MSKFPWLKLWNEGPDDPKFIAVADMAGSTPANAWYAWSKSLTYANQNDPRGTITGIPPQVIASFCRIAVAEVQRIFQAFRELRMLIGDRIANWAKRQTEKLISKVRSNNAERQAKHRAKVADAAAQGDLGLGGLTPVTPASPESVTRRYAVTEALLSTVTSAAEEEEDISEAVASESIAQPTTPEFDEFWARYPRRRGKGAARKAYVQARKTAARPEIMAGVLKYAAECTDRDPRFIKHPATWLAAECWNDDPEPVSDRSHINNNIESMNGRPLSRLEQRHIRTRRNIAAGIENYLSRLAA